MIEGISPFAQTILGTLLTWFLTAAGAGMIFFLPGASRKVLDASLGFAAGVMTAASFWSLLAPAIELAETSHAYGEDGQYAFIPVAIGFLLGALFVYAADIYMSSKDSVKIEDFVLSTGTNKKTDDISNGYAPYQNVSGSARQRAGLNVNASTTSYDSMKETSLLSHQQWKRILLLIVAITVHNVPEGLAVGVGFGAVGNTPLATFNRARYGQLSGLVEPVAGLLGVLFVSLCQPFLPYALAFAAGAMIFVVFDDVIPEAHAWCNDDSGTCNRCPFLPDVSLVLMGALESCQVFFLFLAYYLSIYLCFLL